ncbi:hypothetical protein ACMCNP_00390 [Candidatus Acidulodesulfobacterium sp. H_13]
MKGTAAWMKLKNNTSRTMKSILDRFASGDDYGFNKLEFIPDLNKF